MAPRQNTFTVVPNPMGIQGLMARPANGPESKPPMTSKQVQKAYRERNRGPRLSKAEQRRIELAEQERIRRELDKEKSLSRARTLRERKKAKEKQALDEKRRKGLPLVNVRPSQDTIARFVRRGNGVGNKRDSEGAKVGLPAIEEGAEDDRSITGDDVDKKRESADAEVELPAIEEQEDDRLIIEDGLDKHMPPKEAADTRDRKKRRLDFDPIVDKDDFGVQSTVMSGGAVELRERVPAPEASQLKVTDVEPAPKEAEVSGSAVEFPCEKNRAAEAQEQADGDHMSPVVKRAPDIAVGTVRDQEKDDMGREKVEDGKSEAEGKINSEGTTNPNGNMKPENTTPHQKNHPDTASQGIKALGESLSEAPARTPGILPIQQRRTPAQGTPGCETTLTTPKPQPKGLIVSSMPKKTPVNKAIPTPKPPPTRQHPTPQPQPQRPTSKHTPAQHPSARRVLQEITNSSNRTQPLPGTGGASKFASPFKPALATAQRQAPRTRPVFKQHRPETSTGRLPKPQFLPPPHLRNTAAHQRPSGPASVGKQGKRGRREDIISDSPPTSTQLFVMSHIDDVFPSPSQEAREIEGSLPATADKQPMPAPIRPPIAGFATKTTPRPREEVRRIPYANAPLAPIAGFATRPAPRPKPLMRQVTPANAPMAPPSRPTTVKPVEALDFSFISTQDLLFSSQDLRELEEKTPSKAKATGDPKPPPCKKEAVAIQQRPSPLPHSSGPVFHHAIPQPGTKHPTVTAKARSASPHLPSPAQNKRKKEPCAPKQGSAPRRQHTPDPSRSVSTACPGNLPAKSSPAADLPQRPPSREKPRFFGSNGLGEELLAIERSRRTFEEEERRRLAESRAQRDLARNSPPGAGQAQGKQNSVGTAPCSKHKGEQGQPACPAGNNTKTMSQAKRATAGGSEAITCVASQETDYGDVELDSMDFDELGLGALLA